MKRFLSLSLALTLVLSIVFTLQLPVSAESGTCGENVTWTLADGTLTISGTGDMYDYTNDNPAPWTNANITKVIIEDGVTKIGDSAFSLCLGLTGVTIPNSVTSIGDLAFCYCYSLSAIFIPNSVTSISNNAFLLCDVINIEGYPGSYAQQYAAENNIFFSKYNKCGDNLTWDIENDTLYIGYSGEMYDYSENNPAPWPITDFSTVVIRNGVKSIGNYALSGCKISTISLPTSITHIGDAAFANCQNLVEITIPKYVTSIGEGAFDGCENVTIFGYEGSYAQEYATQNNIPFTAIIIPTEGTCGENLTWSFKDGILTISGTGDMDAISYPDTAPWQLLNVTKAIIEEGVTSIGANAFSYCSELTEVSIPTSVTAIGHSAFFFASKLTEIIIPGNVTNIEGATFQYCEALTRCTLPDTVETIERAAFANCSNLSEINIPLNLQIIEMFAFTGCAKITEMVFPNGVLFIHDDFIGCTSLTKLVVPPSVITFSCHFEKDAAVTIYCFEGSSAHKRAKEYGFKYELIDKSAIPICSHPNTKEQIEIVATCCTDGFTAGSYCEFCEDWISGHDFIERHYIDEDGNVICDICGEPPRTPIKSGFCGNGLNDKHITYTLYDDGYLILSGSGEMKNYYPSRPPYSNDEGNVWGESADDFVKTIVIKDGITSIGEGAFQNFLSVTKIEIPESIVSIGHYAFRNCDSLTEITIPKSVTEIKEGTFSECDLLETVKLSAVVEIGEKAFVACRNLMSITLPKGLKTIGKSAFNSCEKLSRLTLPEGVETIGDGAFFACRELTEVVIPDGVTFIDSNAFGWCDKLTTIVIPQSVTLMGDDVVANTTTIYGIEGSYAETYANENGIPFVEDCPHSNTAEHTEQPASCAVSGYTAGTFCEDCETWISGHAIITAHFEDKDDNNICDVCGLGDIDNDNKIGITDALAVFKHIAGKETLKDKSATAADVTADGKINIGDALQLFKYLAGKITDLSA